MSKIVLVAALTFLLVSIAHGQKSELPDMRTPSVNAGGTADVPAPQATEGTGGYGGPSTAGVAEGAGETAPTTRPAGLRTAPGRGTEPEPQPQTPGVEAGAAVPGTGYVITLRDAVTGAVHVFEVREGASVTLGDKAYVIASFRTSGGRRVLAAKKTPEQIRLEHKLRSTILPELKFEDSDLGETADFLSREGDVNIIVAPTDLAKDSDLKISLRLKNIPLYDAIRYVAEAVQLRFRVDDHAVVITTP